MSILPKLEPLLSDVRAEEFLGLHPKTVQRMARSGVDRTTGKADLPQPQPLRPQGQKLSHFEPLLRVEEAATLLGGMHPKTLMRLARLGEVPAIKIGRCWFFRASALNDWVDVQSQPHRPCHTERRM